MTPTPPGPETPDPDQSVPEPEQDVPDQTPDPDQHEAVEDGPVGTEREDTLEHVEREDAQREALRDTTETVSDESGVLPSEPQDDVTEVRTSPANAKSTPGAPDESPQEPEDVPGQEESSSTTTEEPTPSTEHQETSQEKMEPAPPATLVHRHPVPELPSFPGEYAPDPQEETAPEFRTLLDEMTHARGEWEAVAGEPGSSGTDVGEAEPDDSTDRDGHEDVGRSHAWQRLLAAMRPRATRAQLVAFVLCGVLGFALFVSVRQTQEQGLSSLRQSDLFSLLDSVSERSAQLEDEARRLEQVEDQLKSGSDTSAAAQEAAAQRLEVLGILAGTAPAQGPGIQLDIADPEQRVDAAMVLDIIEELRDAGAEVIQVDDARVVASTAFVDEVEGVSANGQALTIPYRILVIGDPQTLSAALDIPGGVMDTLRQVGATGAVVQKDTVVVSALLPAKTPQFARPT